MDKVFDELINLGRQLKTVMKDGLNGSKDWKLNIYLLEH